MRSAEVPNPPRQNTSIYWLCVLRSAKQKDSAPVRWAPGNNNRRRVRNMAHQTIANTGRIASGGISFETLIYMNTICGPCTSALAAQVATSPPPRCPRSAEAVIGLGTISTGYMGSTNACCLHVNPGNSWEATWHSALFCWASLAHTYRRRILECLKSEWSPAVSMTGAQARPRQCMAGWAVGFSSDVYYGNLR